MGNTSSHVYVMLTIVNIYVTSMDISFTFDLVWAIKETDAT